MTHDSRPPRRTKIVATLGPASQSETVLTAMLDAGVNVVRLNMSHGSQDEHAARVRLARSIAEQRGYALAVLLDLQGPKIRTGLLAGGVPVPVPEGSELTITTEQIPGSQGSICTSFTDLPSDVKAGDSILLDDGAIELRVRSTTEHTVTCDVLHGGLLGEHKGINLPGVAVSCPALTAKDEADLRFGLAIGVDLVALSFVRDPADATMIKSIIRASGKTTPVIAKLEKPQALAHLDAILAAFDGVMVARGDLGVELPLERVPMLQKRIIRRALHFGKPVITATQMLESMTEQPRPTRAEASDVANAICDGTDAVMLSGETARGLYPVETVVMMDRIARQAESSVYVPDAPRRQSSTQAHAVAHAACSLAEEVKARAIVVFTRSGTSAHLVSQWRPSVPAYAYTCEATTHRTLALSWGIEPVLVPFRGGTDTMLATVSAHLAMRGVVHEGDLVVFVGSTPLLVRGRTNFIKLHAISRQAAGGAP